MAWVALCTALHRGHQITVSEFPSPTSSQAGLAGQEAGRLEVFHSKKKKKLQMTVHPGLTVDQASLPVGLNSVGLQSWAITQVLGELGMDQQLCGPIADSLEGHGLPPVPGPWPWGGKSQRKAMPKNAQTTAQLHSSHMLVK